MRCIYRNRILTLLVLVTTNNDQYLLKQQIRNQILDKRMPDKFIRFYQD